MLIGSSDLAKTVPGVLGLLFSVVASNTFTAFSWSPSWTCGGSFWARRSADCFISTSRVTLAASQAGGEFLKGGLPRLREEEGLQGVARGKA